MLFCRSVLHFSVVLSVLLATSCLGLAERGVGGMFFASSGWAPGAVVAPERTGNSRVAVNLPRGWSGGGGGYFIFIPAGLGAAVLLQQRGQRIPPRALSGL